MQTDKRDYWLRHIEASDKFEGTQQEYCAQNGVNASTLSAYKSTLGKGRRKQHRKFARVEVLRPIGSEDALPDPKWLAGFLRAWGEHAKCQ